MRIVRIVRNHPLIVLALLLAGFGAWVAADALSPHKPRTLDDIALVVSPALPQPAYTLTKPMPRLDDPTPPPSGRPGVVTTEIVAQLHLGMARVDVEGLIGPPPAELVDPVSTVDGRPTYRITYLANLSPPNNAPGVNPTPRSLIALEFDASRPGHPLIKVHLPIAVSKLAIPGGMPMPFMAP